MARRNPITVEAEQPDAFRFTFSTDDGKMIGRISVRLHGVPDPRTFDEKRDAARAKFKVLARALHETLEEK